MGSEDSSPGLGLAIAPDAVDLHVGDVKAGGAADGRVPGERVR